MNILAAALILLVGLAGSLTAADVAFETKINNRSTASQPYGATDYIPLVRGSTTYRAIGSSFATLSDLQTLTNKTITCANNTCTVRIGSDVTGLGTGVATALAVNVGSAGAFVKNNGDALSGTFSGAPTLSGNLTFSGVPIFTGLSAGTQTKCLGLDSSNNLVYAASACGSGGGGTTEVGAGVAAGQSPLGMGNDTTALASGHYVYYTNAAFTAPRSKNLPASATQGAGLIVIYDQQRTLTSTNTLTLCAVGTDTVDGGGAASCTAAIGVAGGALFLQNDGAGKWSTVVSNTLGAQAATSNNFLTGLGSDGIFTRAQPSVSNISGFGTGVATWLGTPSSANLASALTDETGTGAAVFAGSPALTGVPTAPTAALATNTTQLATTAFVIANAGGGGSITCDSGWTATKGVCQKTVTADGTASLMTWQPVTGDNYKITCPGLVPASGTPDFRLQFHQSGGSWLTSTTYEDEHVVYQMSGAGSAGAGGSTSATGVYLSDGTRSYHQVIDISGLTSAVEHGVTTSLVNLTGGINYGLQAWGVEKSTVAMDGFRITTSAGNIASGVKCTATAL